MAGKYKQALTRFGSNLRKSVKSSSVGSLGIVSKRNRQLCQVGESGADYIGRNFSFQYNPINAGLSSTARFIFIRHCFYKCAHSANH